MPKAILSLHPSANHPQGLAKAILAADNGFGQRGHKVVLREARFWSENANSNQNQHDPRP